MSYYNRIKEVDIHLPTMRTSFSGTFDKIEAFQGTEFPKGSGIIYEHPGTRRQVGWPSDNVILDQALDWYSTDNTPNGNNQMQRCFVGSGNTPETESDTGMETVIAISDSTQSTTWGAQASAPRFGWRTHVYRFNAGFGGGPVNINEVGVGAGTTTGTQYLCSRALTRDGNGDPTTISVLATEYLDVYYTRRQYPGHIVDGTDTPSDATGTIDISGATHNYTTRCAQVHRDGWGEYCHNHLYHTNGDFGYTYTNFVVFGTDSTLGTVIQGPQATEGETVFWTQPKGFNSYTGGTYNQTAYTEAGLDHGNLTDPAVGINGIQVHSTRGAYQTVLTQTVAKTNTKIFRFYFNWTWDQYTIP